MLVVMALGSAPLTAQGVEIKRGANVLHGSAAITSSPATIDAKKVEKATPEYRTIKADGVRKGSARYEILVAKMHKRIKKASKAAADATGCDFVVRKGDIKDSKGLQVVDLTQEVIDELES